MRMLMNYGLHSLNIVIIYENIDHILSFAWIIAVTAFEKTLKKNTVYNLESYSLNSMLLFTFCFHMSLSFHLKFGKFSHSSLLFSFITLQHEPDTR